MKTELAVSATSAAKPTNRGKFSPDRDYFEESHRRRFSLWQLGASIPEIARDEAISETAVRHSISWCEGRLPKAEVVDARATRLRLRAFNQLAEKYVDELQSLMEDPNPMIRLKALEAFRRTTGMESSAGVNVNVSQQTAVVASGASSFESMLTRVRAAVATSSIEAANPNG